MMGLRGRGSDGTPKEICCNTGGRRTTVCTGARTWSDGTSGRCSDGTPTLMEHRGEALMDTDSDGMSGRGSDGTSTT